MASLFKKTFAVVLALAMVFTCLTANAANEAPSISVSAGYINAQDESNDVSLKISTDNFDVIYGSDFTITIPAGYEFVSIDSDKWVRDSNYVVNSDENTIRFLDVRTNAGFDFTLNLKKVGEADTLSEVELAANMFVDASEAKYSSVVLNNGVISIINTPVTDDGNNGEIVEKEGYFIPYGSVVDATTGKYAEKDTYGKFDGGSTVSYFKLPTKEIGVTTFGSSVKNKDEDKNIDPGVQFGSYAVDTSDKTYGTLVIMGDFVDFKSVYSSMDEVAIYKKLASIYTNNKPTNRSTLKVKYADNKYVYIALVDQKKYMWKGTVNGVAHLQYAVRVTNPTPRTYTSVAYNISNDVYTFSKEASAYTFKAAE